MSELNRDAMLIRLNSSTHMGSMLGVFEDLLKTETMVDITLCAEGKFIQAHKVILASSSIYFKDLLFHLQQQQQLQIYPVIWLKDIPFKQLEWLVKYMYTGQVDIPQSELHSLIKTASELKVVGLSTASMANNEQENEIEDNQDNDDEEEDEQNDDDHDIAISILGNFEDNDDEMHDSNLAEMEHNHPVLIKLERNDEQKPTNSKSTTSSVTTAQKGPSREILVSSIEDINDQNNHKCSKCGKKYTSSKSLWRHKKFACDGNKHNFVCQICNKIFSRSDNLRRHSLVAHSIV